MPTFKEYLILLEATHTCPSCHYQFGVPDWLDTELKCPKCKSVVNSSQFPGDSQQNITTVMVPLLNEPNTKVSVRVHLDNNGNYEQFGRTVVLGATHQDVKAEDLIKNKQISFSAIIQQAKKNLKFI